MKVFRSLCLVLGMFGLIESSALAELPDSVSVRYRVSKKVGRRVDAAIHLITVSLPSTLGLGENCQVDLGVCVSAFSPESVPDALDNRSCEGEEIGTVSLGAGDNTATIRTRSRVASEFSSGRGRQASVQVRATCTDGTDTVEVISDPKARKISVNGAIGASAKRVVGQMGRNFNG